METCRNNTSEILSDGFFFVCLHKQRVAMIYTGIGKIAMSASLRDAVEGCFAPDGSLYMPSAIPVLPRAFFNNVGDMSLRDIAYIVATTFFGGDVSPSALKHIADEAFGVDAPFVSTNDVDVLELFHGYTMTVKDYGARFMASLLKELFPTGAKRLILVATTGNTGGAVASAFSRMPDAEVYVLYPRGRLSRMDVAQFSSSIGNVHPVEVAGDIEQCKQMVFRAVTDEALSELHPTVAGSVNVARLLPLVSLPLYAYGRLVASDRKNASSAIYSIPCGNLSLLTATVIAIKMGMPYGSIIPAYNTNSSLGVLLNGRSDIVSAKPHVTSTPAVDMIYPAGWPRLDYLNRPEHSLRLIDIGAIDDTLTAQALLHMRSQGYTIDPHGAMATAAALTVETSSPRVVFATGHPAKQLDIMTRITGAAIELPVQLTRFMNVRVSPTKIAPTLPALRKLILHNN